MRKIYFFKLSLDRNEQGENWKVLHALPGQTTFLSYSDRNHPLNTDIKVQVCRSENSYVVRHTPGTVFAVCHEGTTERDTRLPVYSRNDVPFYRTESRLYVVDGTPAEVREIPSHITDAWRSYQAAQSGSQEEGEAAFRPQPSPAPSASASSPSPSTDTVRPVVEETVRPSATPAPEVSVPGNELNLIEDALRASGRFTGETALLTHLLLISRLRDRMRTGAVRFVFTKQNGDMRRAVGTRNRDCIGALTFSGNPSGSRQTGNDGAHFCYFDVEKADWRCFCVEDLQSVTMGDVIVDANQIRSIRTEFVRTHPHG